MMGKKYKIAQVCPYALSRPGGVPSSVTYSSKAMRKKGHEVKIIVPRMKASDDYGDDVILLGKGVALSLASNQTRGEICFLPFFDNQVLAILEREKFDIIHIHQVEVPFLCWDVLNKAKAKIILSTHTAFDERKLELLPKVADKLLRPVFRNFYEKASGVIAASSVAKKCARRNYDGEIKVIPNGVDLEFFKSEGTKIDRYNDEKINILFLGRLDERKGCEYLIKAYKNLRGIEKNVRLIIAGDGPLRNKLKKMVCDYQVDDVDFVGFVNEKDKPKYYRTSDIFCAPSIGGESQGIVLLEAMACSAAVVAYGIDGYKTVIKGKASKYLAKVGSVIDLAEKLKMLVRNKKERGELIKYNLEEVKKYCWDKVAEQVLDVYDDAFFSEGDIST